MNWYKQLPLWLRLLLTPLVFLAFLLSVLIAMILMLAGETGKADRIVRFLETLTL